MKKSPQHIHFVHLIRDDADGRVLHWRREPDSDTTGIARAWGKPVGTFFGTYLEIWMTLPQASILFFPFASAEAFRQDIASATDPAKGGVS